MKGKIQAILLCGVFSLISICSLNAQLIYNIPITGTYERQAIPDILADFEKKFDIRIYYDPGRIPLYPVSHSFDKVELRIALKEVLKGSNMIFTKYDDRSIVITRYTGLDKANADRIVEGWKSGGFISPTSIVPMEQEATLGTDELTSSGPFDERRMLFVAWNSCRVSARSAKVPPDLMSEAVR